MKPLDLSTSAARMVQAFVAYERETSTSARDIVARLCAETGLTVDELKGRATVARIARPRQELMFRLHQSGKSLPWIGQYMGGRDHTTILHGVRAHKRRMGMQ